MMPEHRHRLHLYRKIEWVRLRSEILLARFLKGREVRAVWAQFEDKQGRLSRPRLMISTNVGMSAVAVVEAYAKRWAIEPMFKPVEKRLRCQGSLATSPVRFLARCGGQLRPVAFGLTQLLALTQDAQGILSAVGAVARPMTAGRVCMGLARVLVKFDVRACWNPKSRKFDFEKLLKPQPKAERRPHAA